MFGRFVFGIRAIRAAIIVALVVRITTVAGTASADAAEAKKIFTTRCMACHTFGKGVKVGPDLKGVNERRQRPWVIKFVQSSSAVIASGDPIATQLFDQFKQQRMPDWTDLSEPQINSILDWLAANGPDVREIDERFAESATLAEIENGRQLFHGERALANGGTACASCHRVRGTGGTFAADLTTIYSEYQDGAFTQFLRHPCFERLPESASAAFLTPAESFYIKGYLRQAVLDERSEHGATNMAAKTLENPGPGNDPGHRGAPAKPGAATKRVDWTPTVAQVASAAHPRGARLTGTVLYVGFPYLALLVLIIGLVVRFVMTQRRPGGLRERTNAAWQLFSGRPAWRVGLIATAILHLLGLVVPRAIVAWNGVPLRLYLLEGSGFVFGAIMLIGWLQIIARYLQRSPSAARPTGAEIADSVMLSLFCVAIVSGLVIAASYRWGSSWSTGTLTPYLDSLARGAPATNLIEELPFLARLHVLSWFAVIGLLPFTGAALVIAAVLHRGLMVIGRPFEAMATRGRRATSRLSPARWLWPEEDAIELVGDDNAQEPS